MPTQVQNRRGTTAEHSTFTGANGELTVDTTKKTVVVHDGTTAGGVPLMRESGTQDFTTSGNVTLANQADLRLGEATANGSHYVAFQAPSTVASNVTWTLPAADGTSGQVLGTNGSGTLSWTSAGSFTVTVTSTSKTLANKERCTITASGQTLTLPASPTAGDEVAVTVAGTFTDTVIARNGSNIMSLAENMTIDKGDITVTLYYVDATRGWRII